MTRTTRRRISAASISLLHVAKHQLDMDDDAYRALLARSAGVRTAKDLDERGFVAALRELERCGFQRPAVPVKSTAGREGWPTEAQWHRLETLARKVGYEGLTDSRFVRWMEARGKVSHPQFLDAAAAQNVISALSQRLKRAHGSK
ncbi:regulatory protein GemA [Burkholderia cepacia]|uniref:regulatory protein GemA n=1 Tax=Burkholderia cepacia TaxID=292 RepID=UPI001CF5EED7|nr:regulatory protein GemA [Burkholderia cepacia]MCA8060687.1 regulatory protein GemA [Burkholderia cepacia]